MSIHIDPRRLAILLAVQREGGIVAAADALRLSPSAVSQQLARLESETGLRVVERTPHGALITPAGAVLVAGAERIETELADMVRALHPFTGTVTGSVMMGSFQSLMGALLLRFRHQLAAVLPGVDLRLAEVDEPQGMAELRSGQLDLLCIERDARPGRAPRGYTDTPFYDEPWVLVTPPGAPRINSPRDLASLVWLRQPEGTAGDQAMQRITAPLGRAQYSDYRYTSYSVAVAMISDGMGATVMPQLALVDAQRGHVQVTPMPELGVRRLFVRHRTRLAATEPAVSQLIDQLIGWAATALDPQGAPTSSADPDHRR
ncbi:DNA-binding transcriptional regulator, LysR family [Propionibacterium cyclohexanicum]|uniref:DNA-binding transcriptional regulator, LysR family n=1 Tax=Propionibacterium cyclohexanicum TaxID=64702 RepID=A0A1H9Q5M4_9ACTN|nr:LysR family transcriptional regulator [Propionibacterium cyclohexanicum]SER55435.1 DNA-binding transcriptional regulator, LysR family [Propionibacterium cyclohexanicum]